jgi:hypothetical protein
MLRGSLQSYWLNRKKQLVVMALLATSIASGAPNKGMVTAAEDFTIFVSDVGKLYEAVNEPANAGAAIVLSEGVYTLSASASPGTGGRLELQRDMSLYGVSRDRECVDRSAVKIDPSGLPALSFQASGIPGRTGVIRIGRGTNAIECLTIARNWFAAAAIETDLVEGDPIEKNEAGEPLPLPTAVRIAHVVAGDIARGVDIRNITKAMAGRHLDAVIENSEFSWAVEGIRVINFQGNFQNANGGGRITVAMTGNYLHANRLGCIFENNRSNFGSVYVVSTQDRFDDNGLGCQVGGGLTGAPGETNDSIAKFDAYGSKFTKNTRTVFNPNVTGPPFTDMGGLLAIGGDVVLTGAPGSSSRNTVVIRLWDVIFADNEGNDFQAFGARCLQLSADGEETVCEELAGMDNHALIQLHGLNASLDVIAIDSEPPDPNGTNTVKVVRIPNTPHH